jgi:hypothetical protein
VHPARGDAALDRWRDGAAAIPSSADRDFRAAFTMHSFFQDARNLL